VIKNPLLKSFWIESRRDRPRVFGVTAYSVEDAFELLNVAGHVLSRDDPNSRITEGIQFADLDQMHIVPNMGPIVLRGVWYPLNNL
jgi:hypothetical protein